jgi:hypothetical protein
LTTQAPGECRPPTDALAIVLQKPGAVTRTALFVCLAAMMTPIGRPLIQQGESSCQPKGAVVALAGLPEASGLAASPANPGRLWSHNDSGKPEIFSIDASGQVIRRVAVLGATVEDWEAIASIPCGKGVCLFIADIGDNTARRKFITIYRIAEPASGAASVNVDAVLRASYPDGPQDAEALLASRDGTLYVVTKGETGPVALYRLPSQSGGDAPVRLERVGPALADNRTAQTARITDGAVSLDNELVALRSVDSISFYRAAHFLKGEFRELWRVDLKPLREPQGEGIAFGANGSVYLAGEGGGRNGTFAVLSCSK